MDKKKYVRVDPFTGFPEKVVGQDARPRFVCKSTPVALMTS